MTNSSKDTTPNKGNKKVSTTRKTKVVKSPRSTKRRPARSADSNKAGKLTRDNTVPTGEANDTSSSYSNNVYITPKALAEYKRQANKIKTIQSKLNKVQRSVTDAKAALVKSDKVISDVKTTVVRAMAVNDKLNSIINTGVVSKKDLKEESLITRLQWWYKDLSNAWRIVSNITMLLYAILVTGALYNVGIFYASSPMAYLLSILAVIVFFLAQVIILGYPTKMKSKEVKPIDVRVIKEEEIEISVEDVNKSK